MSQSTINRSSHGILSYQRCLEVVFFYYGEKLTVQISWWLIQGTLSKRNVGWLWASGMSFPWSLCYISNDYEGLTRGGHTYHGCIDIRVLFVTIFFKCLYPIILKWKGGLSYCFILSIMVGFFLQKKNVSLQIIFSTSRSIHCQGRNNLGNAGWSITQCDGWLSIPCVFSSQPIELQDIPHLNIWST